MQAILEIGNFLKGLIKYFGPILIIVVSAIIIASWIKWGYKINDAIRIIFKNPIFVAMWIIAIVFLIILFFKYVSPLL